MPRSGSTLLSAVWRHNPRFPAFVSSAVQGPVSTVLPVLSNQEFAPVTEDALQQRVLLGLFDAYYPERHAQVVFDTNPLWTEHLPLLAELFPQSRMVCCVRDVGWMLNSVEQMLA